MSKCNICPRKCNVDREKNEKGVCSVNGKGIYVARALLHMWEEPCISGREGSGTIFFSGCNLRCVYCQNYEISKGMAGRCITVEELSGLLTGMQEKGANNINLVTPTHYIYEIREAVSMAKKAGLTIPVVYNSSGYELAEIIEAAGDFADIYLVDFKYMEEETALKYSKAWDYPEVAKKAIKAMVDNTGKCQFDDRGIMKKGVIVRHLLLPNHVKEGKAIIKYIYDLYGDDVFISLMNQYTPVSNLAAYPEINRRVTKREYNKLVDYAIELGIENAFIQEGDTAKESFIPSFDEAF